VCKQKDVTEDKSCGKAKSCERGCCIIIYLRLYIIYAENTWKYARSHNIARL